MFLVKHMLDGVSLGNFACKRVPVGNNHAWLEKVLNEVQLLQSLSHTNLVSYRHVWLEDMVIHSTSSAPLIPNQIKLMNRVQNLDLAFHVPLYYSR